MLVQDIMQTDLVTVSPATTLGEALSLARQRGIRHLLVVDDDGNLAGIVSDRDLKEIMVWPAGGTARGAAAVFPDDVSVRDVMTKQVVTIAPMFPIEDAARVMVRRKISALPVIEADRLVGIVTETDVLTLFVRSMGAAEPSSRLDVVLGESASALAGIVAAIEGAGAPISSIMTLTSPAGAREAVVRVGTINPGPAIGALEALGFRVRWSWRGQAGT
jgi:acetoin utilization protein AcuB